MNAPLNNTRCIGSQDRAESRSWDLQHPTRLDGADYSCGCMDYGFKREKQPWEASDGAVYLLAGLSEVSPAEVPPLMPVLSEIALLDHWRQARSLQTTIWSQVPRIMNGLGKQVKEHHS